MKDRSSNRTASDRSPSTPFRVLLLFFILNREDFSFVIHLDRQPRTSRRREAQTGSRARSGSRSERTLDAVEHSRTLMEWWPFLIFHRGGLRIKVINNTCPKTQTNSRLARRAVSNRHRPMASPRSGACRRRCRRFGFPVRAGKTRSSNGMPRSRAETWIQARAAHGPERASRLRRGSPGLDSGPSCGLFSDAARPC